MKFNLHVKCESQSKFRHQVGIFPAFNHWVQVQSEGQHHSVWEEEKEAAETASEPAEVQSGR